MEQHMINSSLFLCYTLDVKLTRVCCWRF